MKHRNVLLIDDDPIFNIITRKTLERIQFADKITTMTSAASALRYLSETGQDTAKLPDLIFLDLRMLEMSGFDFLEEYAKMPEKIKKASKILILTSSDNKEDIDRLTSNPYVIRYLSKPLDAQQLTGLESRTGT